MNARGPCGRLSGWVVSARIERMTATDPQQSLPGPPQSAVFFDGLYEIVAARRLETAVPAQKWANRQLIKTDTSDQYQAGQLPELYEPDHGCAWLTLLAG